ncbi:MAG: glutamate-5-semialdehyde dehydrogenase [Elusimicrobiota bacterium]|jgi:glutamate-5-semialdehyde dehydrogenase|nr:glutamate-5-semialdehyde dehydrogenase [Elusimicrobiota bacterium]
MDANSILNQAEQAKKASRALSLLSADAKNNILSAMAAALAKNRKDILFYNEIDVEAAKQTKISAALLDRLTLNEKRIDDMINGIEKLISLEDPIGTEVETLKPTADICVKKIRVPLGVIAMIYEARPNVSVDAASICLKSGNAVILKGGSEAIESNRNLIKIIYEAGLKAGLPEGAIQFMNTTDREAVGQMIKLDKFIDLIIPRGSEELVNFVRRNSLIPVLSHGKGICHLYIDKDADIDIALKIAINAKCQRAGVCNAIETLLVHKDIAKTFLPLICKAYAEKGVIIKGDEMTRALSPEIKIEAADEKDWETEYHDLIISIKTVDSLEEAIAHINKYGSQHTDSIVTKDEKAADKFLAEVDSSAVMLNASTRLHDGSVFGLGCEIGISTQKLHARGVMGINELTTTKYIVKGNGTIRQ